MDQKIIEAEQQFDQAHDNYKQTLIDVQCSCSHKNTVERKYFCIAEWLPAHAPVRVCLDCGLGEEGWGCGHIVVKNKPQRWITNKEEAKYRKGKLICESDKGPLLRKEKSLRELLQKQL